jgi:hypothetical protein
MYGGANDAAGVPGSSGQKKAIQAERKEQEFHLANLGVGNI